MTKLVFKLSFYLFSLLLLWNCSNEYNPKLQTKWQLKFIDTNGRIQSVDTIFYNFDNYVFTMQKLTTTYTGENVYGEFHQQGDSIFITFPDPKYAGKERLKKDFQWNDSIRHFQIIELTQSKLCLQDRFSKLSFRKY